MFTVSGVTAVKSPVSAALRAFLTEIRDTLGFFFTMLLETEEGMFTSVCQEPGWLHCY